MKKSLRILLYNDTYFGASWRGYDLYEKIRKRIIEGGHGYMRSLKALLVFCWWVTRGLCYTRDGYWGRDTERLFELLDLIPTLIFH